jgi:aldose 1-epimerase
MTSGFDLSTAPLLRVLLVALTALSLSAENKQPFGKLPDGQTIFIYTLTNAHGIEARITNFGAILVSLKVPDRTGKLADVVLGFDTLDEYVHAKRFYGATVGRFANRIAGGRFTLGGVKYTLARNSGENSMHGGSKGFNKVVWQESHWSPHPASLELSYLSKDGEEGFPGNLSVHVKFALTDKDELRIDYSAETDKTTVVNLTNHSFFNLAGEGTGDVMGHIVTINADRITPVDSNMIPTGELRSVQGTPFDFRRPTAIGTRLHDNDAQLKIAKGYDHNYVLNHKAGELGLAARVTEPQSGRVLTVSTTEPGMQFYTANNLDGSGGGKGGKSYGPYSAFCLETQHFPDSPNRPSFPTTELRPGEHFHSTTVFRFSTQ